MVHFTLKNLPLLVDCFNKVVNVPPPPTVVSDVLTFIEYKKNIKDTSYTSIETFSIILIEEFSKNVNLANFLHVQVCHGSVFQLIACKSSVIIRLKTPKLIKDMITCLKLEFSNQSKGIDYLQQTLIF